MKTLVDPRLTGEAALFRLRFACDDCVHFASERKPTCGHGWPVRLRRSALDAPSEGADGPEHERADERGALSFCKEFELA